MNVSVILADQGAVSYSYIQAPLFLQGSEPVKKAGPGYRARSHVQWNLQIRIGHFGISHFVLSREVVLFLKVENVPMYAMGKGSERMSFVTVGGSPLLGGYTLHHQNTHPSLS